jgi:hypothetical protein
MNNSVVSAVFDNYDEAERALQELRRAGVRESALSVIAQRDGKTTETSDGHTTEHDGHGSIIRGLLGGGALGAWASRRSPFRAWVLSLPSAPSRLRPCLRRSGSARQSVPRPAA